MQEDIWLMEGFRKPEPAEIDPCFYVCGGRYSYDEIEAMTWDEFGFRRHGCMPSKLYKYFPNTTYEGKNRSIQALENNTVYLEEVKKFDDNYDCTLSINEKEFARLRITYYAENCGMKVAEEWNYEKCAEEFAHFLYQEINKGHELEHIFGINPLTQNGINSSMYKDMTKEIFCLRLKLSLTQNNQNDAWPRAFYEAIHNEYLDMVEVMDRFRIACFTTSPYMINMWSNHYADNNKGFCIEYQMPDLNHRTDNLCSHIFPIVYSDARKDVLNKCMVSLNDDMDKDYLAAIYKYGVLAKSKSIWGQQDEWRLVSCDNMLADDYNCKFYPITKVYLGERMEKDNRRMIIDICERKGIPYVGVIRDKEKYQMIECPHLCKKCISSSN